VIVTGTGGEDKAFIAGADIQMVSEIGPGEAFDMSDYSYGVLGEIEEFDRVSFWLRALDDGYG